MFFPEKIEIFFLDRNINIALPNIAIQIKLFAHSHNDYYFLPKLSDTHGMITISKEWINQEIQKCYSLFIMDYKSSLEQCTSEIELEVLSVEHIEMLIESLKKWISIIPYVTSQIDMLMKCNNKNYIPKYELLSVNEKSENTYTILLDKSSG